jgi:hypothetical protein
MQQVNRSRNKALDNMTFSGKKGKNTLTSLTIVAPGGTPLFRPPSQPSNITDVTLARCDEMFSFYKLLQSGEYLMGDKGFYGMEDAYPDISLPFKKNGGTLTNLQGNSITRWIAFES